MSTSSPVQADAADRMLGLARTVAVSPGVAARVTARDVGALQPVAEAVRSTADASFVTIMTPDGTRLTHPDVALIGQTYQGTFAPAARRETLVETFSGTLGPSVRAIVPITADGGDGRGPVVGMVAVGLLRVDVVGRVLRELGFLALGAALGIGPALVAVRRCAATPVVNDEATRLLGLGAGAVGRTLPELGVDPALAARLADPSPVTDETLLVGERLPLLDRTRTDDSWVITLRGRTEVAPVMQVLDDARSVAGALRFQAHEHANHLQAVSTMIELGAHQDARELAVRWTGDLGVAALRAREHFPVS